MATKSNTTKLYRSESNKVIAGICGGLGDYFDIDPVILRVFFAFLTIFGGGGVLLYLILWIVIPLRSSSKDYINDNMEEIKIESKKFIKKSNSKLFVGILLIFIGLSILSENLGFYNFSYIWRFWPIILVFIGLRVITNKH